MNTEIQVNDTVTCIKDDPGDNYYGIPYDKQWHIGDTFVVARIEYGTVPLLYDDYGHSLKMHRALKLNFING